MKPDQSEFTGGNVNGIPASEVGALVELGKRQSETGRNKEAIVTLRRAIALSPTFATAREALSHVMCKMGDLDGAMQEFGKAADMSGITLEMGIEIGEALVEKQGYTHAVLCGRRLVDAFPYSPEAHSLLARALLEITAKEEALQVARKAVELDPSSAFTVTNLGLMLQTVGRMDEAEAAFKEAISLEPGLVSAYSGLVFCRKVGEADLPLIEAIERLAEQNNGSPEAVAHLEYALGKAYQDLGKFETAMRHFDLANRLTQRARTRGKAMDRKAYAASVDNTERLFTANLMRRHRKAGFDSELPIFVVGMMRSGTTLVEQILSSHSKVGGAGEQAFWMARGKEAMAPGMLDVHSKALRRLGEEYVHLLKRMAPDMDRAVDKAPGNYSQLGLIHLALPKAKIVHVQRHPVDTCLSIYTTPSRSQIDWANDKEDIAFVYGLYRRFMRHWSSVLPKDTLLTVQYEELVRDRERTTHAIIEFCGLEWDEACLYPERNDRAVSTPSIWQVRQPVYATSIDRWQKYEPWLGPLRDLL